MRYGLLSDVHANLQALRATVEELRRVGVDRWIVAGDLVGYGAQPNECIEVVAELDALCVVGNHDLIALGQLCDARCVRLARNSLRWTRDVLAADSRSFLAALPVCAAREGVGPIGFKRSMICACWHMLATAEIYNDLGGDYYARRDPNARPNAS